MRCVFAAIVAAAVLSGSAAAQADSRVFIIANHPDDYGVDRCLASGGPCGKAVANSYCHTREFAQAVSFHTVDRDDFTASISSAAPEACRGAACGSFVAIECSR